MALGLDANHNPRWGLLSARLCLMKLQDGTFLYLKKLTKPEDKQSWHASEEHWVKYKPDGTELALGAGWVL